MVPDTTGSVCREDKLLCECMSHVVDCSCFVFSKVTFADAAIDSDFFLTFAAADRCAHSQISS